MGKIIERVRAQQAVARKNWTAQAMFDAYCRYADSERASRGRPVVVITPAPSESTHWLKRWWRGY